MLLQNFKKMYKNNVQNVQVVPQKTLYSGNDQ